MGFAFVRKWRGSKTFALVSVFWSPAISIQLFIHSFSQSVITNIY